MTEGNSKSLIKTGETSKPMYAVPSRLGSNKVEKLGSDNKKMLDFINYFVLYSFANDIKDELTDKAINLLTEIEAKK